MRNKQLLLIEIMIIELCYGLRGRQEGTFFSLRWTVILIYIHFTTALDPQWPAALGERYCGSVKEKEWQNVTCTIRIQTVEDLIFNPSLWYSLTS